MTGRNRFAPAWVGGANAADGAEGKANGFRHPTPASREILRMMGKVSYNRDAWEKCRELYVMFGGANHLAIEREMQKEYPSWRRENLYDRGKGKNARLGWINRFGYDRSLEIYNEKLVGKVNDDEQDLYIGIKTVRKEMQKRVVGKDATKDEVYQYRDFCQLEIQARRNLDLSRDNLETFVSGYEKLVGWLSDIDPPAAKMLIKHGEKLSELAQAHYGKAETDDGGTSDREDEGGE